MKDLHLNPAGDSASYYQSFSFKPKRDPHQEVTYVNSDSSITGTNIIGYWDNKAENTIIIGAHYDHLGMGGEGSLFRAGAAIHNGADDNASGVAVMLQLVDSLSNSQDKNNNYLFMAFSGEEIGLLGQ